MKNVICCCLLLLLSSCYEAQEKTTTSSMRTPHEYRWESLPRTLILADLPNEYEKYVDDMADKWSDKFYKTLINTTSTAYANANFVKNFSTIEGLRDGHNAIYLVKAINWPAQSQGALGVTILLGKTNENGQYIIQEADIIIKDVLAYDAQTIIVHELGHFMGLNHSSDSKSVMYPTIREYQFKHTPSNEDYKDLAKLYGLPMVGGAVPHRAQAVKPGTGELQRLVIELGADMNCRHLLDGELIESHTVEL